MAGVKGLLDLGRAAIDLAPDAYRNLLRLIEAGFPDTTAMKIVTGELPMDNASRMTRATEQGYDLDDVTTRWLSEDKQENLIRKNSKYKFGDGIYSGLEPSYGYSYTDHSRSPVAYPMVARGNIASKEDAILAEKELTSRGNIPKDYTQRMNAINSHLKGSGFNGLDYAGERVMFDDNTSKSSLGAAFDPDNMFSSNILATNPAATSLAGLLSLLGISEADGLLSNNRYD